MPPEESSVGKGFDDEDAVLLKKEFRVLIQTSGQQRSRNAIIKYSYFPYASLIITIKVGIGASNSVWT